MKPKMKLKIGIDIFMTAGILLVSGYQFFGDAAHEVLGALLLILFIMHNILNLSWYRNLFKGRYTAFRILQTAVNVMVLISMAVQMYSGIVLSRHVFAFLPIESGMAIARRLHVLGAYWGLIFMSMHLGLHWNMIFSMCSAVTKHKNKRGADRSVKMADERENIMKKGSRKDHMPFAVGALIAVYGLYVFFKRDFPTYLLLRSEFVFLDYSEPVFLFYLDYLALMGACVFLAHFAGKFLQKRSRAGKK